MLDRTNARLMDLVDNQLPGRPASPAPRLSAR